MKAELLDIEGNLIQFFDKQIGDINAVDISSDKRFVVTAGSDSSVNIWYFNTEAQRFDLYNTIHFPDDTIWSVDFAPNCKYVLTASNSGRVMVTDLNGHLAWGAKEKFQVGLADIALGYPFFAEFNVSGKGIVIKSSEKEFCRENYFMSGIYVDIFYISISAGKNKKFDYLGYSPDNKYFIVSSGADNFLISYGIYKKSDFALFNNYKLLQFDGSKPFFSPDGKYIYSICGNHIESWYIDVPSISEIALGFYNKWGDYLK